MADVDAALVQKIFDVPQRQRKSDVHHNRQTDDFGAAVEILEWVVFCHDRML